MDTLQRDISKSDEAILNLSKLLEQQLKIVDEQRIEIRDLREKIDELHDVIKNNFEEYEARIFQNHQKNTVPSPYAPSGFLRKSDDHIHLGRGVWIPRVKYNEASNLNSTSLFVKMMCDILFTIEDLKESTVTGKTSNRKQSVSREPKQLDPTKVMAIKDITKCWLKCLNYSEEAVDLEVSRVRRFISAKIADLQRPPGSKLKRKLKTIQKDSENSPSFTKNEKLDDGMQLHFLPSSESYSDLLSISSEKRVHTLDEKEGAWIDVPVCDILL